MKSTTKRLYNLANLDDSFVRLSFPASVTFSERTRVSSRERSGAFFLLLSLGFCPLFFFFFDTKRLTPKGNRQSNLVTFVVAHPPR